MQCRGRVALPFVDRTFDVRVTDAFRAMSPHWEPMTRFDERDLVRSFVAAGFEAVGVDYELLVTRQSASRAEVEHGFEVRGNPTAPTWREAAEAVLGTDAAGYLTALAAARADRPHTAVTASDLLTATTA